jgi:beta-galactosidase
MQFSAPARPGRRGAARLLAILVIAGGSLVAIAPPPAAAATYTPPATRQQIGLNASWKFNRGDVAGAQNTAFNDASWQSVSVPHTWNAADGADGGGNYVRGIGWYRRHYTPPTSLAGKTLYLQFAGVNQVADVWINGTYLGQHLGGYARFRFAATAALRLGQDNVIAVKVNNANNANIAPRQADFTFMGGVYRDVSLWAVDPLQVRMLDFAGPGVYLRQRSVTATSATVDVTAKLFNNSAASRSVATRTVITDPAGTVVADQTAPARTLAANSGADVVQTITIANPHRWDGRADPFAYRANVEVRDATAGTVTDVVTEPLGLRSFSVDAARGFTLNGHALDLHGVNLHQDYAGVGWAETETQHARDWELIAEVGATTVRLAHYQHDQSDYSRADQLGTVIWAEIPNVDLTTNSAGYTANSEQAMRELIRQNYNHPSIVFWGIGNEQRTDDAATNTLLSRLAALVNTEDPDRLSTYAGGVLTDTATVNNHSEVLAYNKYYGWYTGSYNELGGWADNIHSANPTRRIGLSEYGAGANVTQHALNPPKPTTTGQSHPEEYQSLLHEASWNQLKTRNFLWGKYVWNMFDFAADARAEGAQPGINDKGLVTRDRAIRKDSFYWYKANWSTAPTLYVTSRRWTARTAAATEIKVYSNAGTVNVTLNGTSLGARSSTDRIFKWTGVTLARGQNTVTATATINGTTHTDTVTWTLG